MPHPVKKVYAEGSPGAQRKAAGMTLSNIKKNIKADTNRKEARGIFRKAGLLGPVA